MQFKHGFWAPVMLTGALLAAVATPAAAGGDESGFFIAPEATYFTFTNTDYNYATVGPYDADYLDGRVERLNPDYELGWRLGLGYRWDNNWDFTARWTHTDVESSDSVQATGDNYLFLDHDPFEYYNDFYNGYAEANASEQLDSFDLTVGRTFTSDGGHSARFFAGLRYARFDQSFDVLYVDNDDSAFEDDDDAYSSFMDSTWDGWGVIAGAEGHLAIGEKKEWSFYGALTFGVLMGNTDQKRVDADWYYSDYPNLSDAYDIIIDTHDSFDSTTTVIEAQAGVEWARQFESVKFGIRFGWEIQSWSGIGTLQHYLGYDQSSGRADSTGDIGVSGAFLRASWGW